MRIKASEPDAPVLNLETSAWYAGRQNTGRTSAVALLCLPLIVLAVMTGSQWGAAVSFAVFGLLQIAAMRAQRGAFATRRALHFRSGLLGGRPESVPLSSIEQVWVDPFPFFLPDIGNITVQSGTRYIHFPGVRHAEEAAATLLGLRTSAILNAAGPPEEPGPGSPGEGSARARVA